MDAEVHEKEARFTLRLPCELLDAVKASAKANSRSTNAEIVHRLKQSGSAEVAALMPSQNPNNLPQETAMGSRSNNTAQATAPVTPFDVGPLMFQTEIDEAALAGLSLRHLLDLHDACRTMMEVAAGLVSKPRFSSGGPDSGFNAAGEQIDLFHEIAANALGAVINEAALRAPANREEAIVRAWLVSRAGADCSDDFIEFFQSVARDHASIAAFDGQEAGR